MKYLTATVLLILTMLFGCTKQDEEITAGHPVNLKVGHYYRVEWQMQKEGSKRNTGIALVQDLITLREPLYVWFDKKHLPLPMCFTTTFGRNTLNQYGREIKIGLPVTIVPVTCSKPS